MNRNIIAGICSVALLGSLVFLWRYYHPSGVKVSRTEVINVQTGFGQVLAEETAKAVQDRGHIVVVTTDPPERFKSRANSHWHAFATELEKHNAIQITATEGVTFEMDSGQLYCPRGAFKDIWERHKDADALVFFVDLPEWAAVAEVVSQSGKPKLIAADNAGVLTKVHYGGYFTSGILAALIGKPAQLVPPSQPKTAREWFDKFYQVYTPQNSDMLPE